MSHVLAPRTASQLVRCPRSPPTQCTPVSPSHRRHTVLLLAGSPAGPGTRPEPPEPWAPQGAQSPARARGVGSSVGLRQSCPRLLQAAWLPAQSHMEGGLPRAAGVKERALESASTTGDTSRHPPPSAAALEGAPLEAESGPHPWGLGAPALLGWWQQCPDAARQTEQRWRHRVLRVVLRLVSRGRKSREGSAGNGPSYSQCRRVMGRNVTRDLLRIFSTG